VLRRKDLLVARISGYGLAFALINMINKNGVSLIQRRIISSLRVKMTTRIKKPIAQEN